MKDNDVEASVKSEVAPTLGAAIGPVQAANNAAAKAKAPQKKAGDAAKAGKFKGVPADIPPGAPTKAAGKSKKPETLAVAEGMPKTEKAEPGVKSAKTAKVDATKSMTNPVEPAASRPGVGTASPAPKPPEPKEAEPEVHPQPDHATAPGPAVADPAAARPQKPTPGVEAVADGHGVPAETTAAGTDPDAAGDDAGEARDREIVEAVSEILPLYAEILERHVDHAIRREAKPPEFDFFELREEMAVMKHFMQQIQEIVTYLQSLKRLADQRLKKLRAARRWFKSPLD